MIEENVSLQKWPVLALTSASYMSGEGGLKPRYLPVSGCWLSQACTCSISRCWSRRMK